MAMGLTGEPVVLCRRRGPIEIMNSHRLRSLQASETSSRSALSYIQTPMAVMLTWWIGLGTFSYWGGFTSLPVSEPIMAMPRS